jgi:hypothetical protein
MAIFSSLVLFTKKDTHKQLLGAVTNTISTVLSTSPKHQTVFSLFVLIFRFTECLAGMFYPASSFQRLKGWIPARSLPA